ncbi:MAG: FecR domain-containing protein [Cyclobacteriaceae bacterium]|nr:FecR domain-containing protein [Cyclobacteriaceae bacterium]
MDQEYIKKWLSGTLTEDEQLEFQQSEAYRELQKLDQAIQSFKAPEMDVEKELHGLKLKPQAREIKANWWKPIIRVAAVVLIGVLLFQYYPVLTRKLAPSIEVVQASRGETRTFDLPDASQVTLNASSTINFRTKNWEGNRSLNLQGEAYFKVNKGATFTVETDQGTVTVLGTKFNVKSRNSYFEVVCYEGSVQIKSESYQEIIAATEMFRVVNGTLIRSRDLEIEAPSWVDQVSSFISVPYGEVLKELERQYDVKIESQNIDLQQLFTGSFTHKDVKLALASITQPLNIGYNIGENQTVSLSGEAK